MTNATDISKPPAVLLWSALTAHDYAEAADWAARARENAEKVLTAEIGTEVVRFGTPSLIVAARVWDGRYIHISPSEVIASSDGLNVSRTWCDCIALSEDDWQYYERWTARGCEAHGWACPDCRGIVQFG
jgi:hypothetical protein